MVTFLFSLSLIFSSSPFLLVVPVPSLPSSSLTSKGHRSPAVVVAIMGVLLSGAAYCMMDPKYPTARIITCMNIAGPSAWITIDGAGTPPPKLQDYLDSINLRIQMLVPAPHASFFSDEREEEPADEISADHVAVITFTSGSTGM